QKFLQEKLQLEVRKLQKIRRLEGESVTGAPQFTENVLSFGVATGLALQGLNLTRLQTNLLPHEIRLERLIRAKKPMAVAAAAVLLLAAGILYLGRTVEHRAYANKAVENALEQGKKFVEEEAGYSKEFQAAEDEFTQSKDTVLRIAHGVEQQFNWHQM